METRACDFLHDLENERFRLASFANTVDQWLLQGFMVNLFLRGLLVGTGTQCSPRSAQFCAGPV